MDALPAFELIRPATWAGVLAARAAHPDSRLIGGGTDILVNIRRGILAPPMLIDMNAVAELGTLRAGADAIGVRVTELPVTPDKLLPLMEKAAKVKAKTN